MSLDTAYGDALDQSIKRWTADPGPPPDIGFSGTSFLGSGLKGIPRASMQVAGTVSDLLSAFGTYQAATGASAGGMFATPTDAERKQEAEARERMLHGNPWDFTGGNQLRAKAEGFSPDPLTSSKADQVINEITRFGAKAALSVGTMGPAGAVPLGLEEGNTTAQDLRTQGVEAGTAAKVGAVQGTLSAVGAVLPLGGKTWMQTLGLVGIGGPGSYMAQEHMTRRILENAGQLDLASLHNPFDPLGLALSTAIPGAFGALHMRGEYVRSAEVAAGKVPLQALRPEELRSLKYDDPRLDAYASKAAEANGVPPALLVAIKNAGEKSGPTAVSGKGAQGVMQFMKGTADEMGLADRTDPLASIDAAARYMRKLYDAYGSWDAAVAHYSGGGAQAAIVRGGGRPTYNETAGYLDRVHSYMAEHTAQDAAQSQAAVDAARVRTLNEATARNLPEAPEAFANMQRAADTVAESGGREAEISTPPTATQPAQEGHVRFYHGGAPEDVTGSLWFTADLRDAQGWASRSPNMRVWYVDVPRGAAGVEWGEPHLGVLMPTRQELPAELAGQRRPFIEQQAQQGRFTHDETAQIAALQDERAQLLPVAGELAERGGIRQAREELAQLQRQAPDGSDEAVRALAKDIQGRDGVSYKTALSAAKKQTADLVGDFGARVQRLNEAITRNAAAQQATGRLTEIDRQIAQMERDAATRGQAQPAAAREPDNALPPAHSVALAGDEPAAREGQPGEAIPPKSETHPPEGGAKPAADETKAAEPETLDHQIATRLATEQPDLKVVLPGTDQPISVAEAMKRIAETQAEDEKWAELVRAAGECALAAG